MEKIELSRRGDNTMASQNENQALLLAEKQALEVIESQKGYYHQIEYIFYCTFANILHLNRLY